MAMLPRAAVAGAMAVAKALASDKESEEEKEITTPVDSSVIATISFDPKTEIITVVFHRGGTYQYPGSKDLYEAFVNAPSVGAFFNQHIR